MDAINVVFEKFGGDKITRLFRTFWLVLLVMKQVMFSLFFLDAVVEPSNLNSQEIISKEITAVETTEKNFSSLDLVRVLLNLAQLDPHTLLEDPNKI